MAQLAEILVPQTVGPGSLPEGVRLATHCMSQIPASTYRRALEAMLAFDRRANLPRIQVPTLLVAGEHDRNAPPAVMKKMAEAIPRSTYMEMRRPPAEPGGAGRFRQPGAEFPGAAPRTAALNDEQKTSMDGIAPRFHARRGRLRVHAQAALLAGSLASESGALASHRGRAMERTRELSLRQLRRSAPGPACWGCACLRDHGGLGAGAPNLHDGGGRGSVVFAARPRSPTTWHSVRRCGPVGAGRWNPAMTDATAGRARTPARAGIRRVVQDGAIYAQPFSEGSAAAARPARPSAPRHARSREAGSSTAADLRLVVGRGRLLRRAVHRGQGRPSSRRATRCTSANP